VATRGLHGDGHDFIEDAVEHGAAGALIARGRLTALEQIRPGLLERLERAGVAVIAVEEPREALKAYARAALQAWKPLVIAVTGGVGKTTTKEAIADALGALGPTFRSWRNYNDLLGLPLSLGRLDPRDRFAVVEMGADHPGEIAELCAIAHPTIGVVTNTAPTQLQYFGSLDALTEELAQLPASLSPGGLAVLSADDAATPSIAQLSQSPIALFSSWHNLEGARLTNYRITPLVYGPAGHARLHLRSATDQSKSVTFPNLIGAHWAGAILAALTVAVHLGADEEIAIKRLRELQPLPGRLRQLEGVDGLTLLDDSHNASPESIRAGLTALVHYPPTGGIVALGDMLRLGDYEPHINRELGERLAKGASTFNIRGLVTRGPQAERVADAAIAAGFPAARIIRTLTAEDAAAAVRTLAAGEPATVYLKGSEEARMEQVTALLMAHPDEAATQLDRQTDAWRRVVVSRPDRPTWVEVDLAAIANNTRRVKELAGPATRVLASLKADAYGHGALRVARVALRNGAEWLGVATVSEARPLREAGVTAPILVFGYTPPWQAREAVRLDLRATVFDLASARALGQAASEQGRVSRVHIKVDTGMARLGLRAEDPAAIVAFAQEIAHTPGLLAEGVFTHFATADGLDPFSREYAQRQLDRFEATLRALEAAGVRPPIVHAANSAATLTIPESRYDMVRPGVAIYGLPPSDEVPLPAGFKPALAFKTLVAQVKTVPAGEGISYGATYITERPMRIATLPVGYADGFRRAPASWGEVLVRGRRAPIRGRVAMDQCMVDVTEIPGVEQGDEVTLIGRQGEDELTAQAVAMRLGTSAYEVVSALLARVPRLS
jgi:alanine racemase